MPYELSVCLRYLRPRASRAYISINTVISILGLAVGVMTLIVVIAVMSGFARNLRERSIGLSSHIEIFNERSLISNWRDVEQKIRQTPHVAAVSPFVWGDLTLGIDNVSYVIFFRAVDPGKVAQVSKLPEYLVYFICPRCGTTYTRLVYFICPRCGTTYTREEYRRNVKDGVFKCSNPGCDFVGEDDHLLKSDLRLEEEEYRRNVKDGVFKCSKPECDFVGEDDHLLKSDLRMEEVEILDDYGEKELVMPLVLGKALCDHFGLKLGDTVKIASAGIGAFGERPRRFWGRISGIFRSGLAEEDMKLGYTSLRCGQIIQGFSESDLIHGFSVTLDNIEYCNYAKRLLTKRLGGRPYAVKTWMELRLTLFRAIQQERVIMFIIVGLITAVAALNIISSLTMTVMHKRKEIGILRSMGARRASITAIFALSGIIIGIVGILVGVTGGLLLSYNIDPVADWVSKVTGTTKLFSGDIFYLDRIPVNLSGRDIAVICAVALVLSIVASIYPAWKAAVLDPVEVLRYE